MPKQYQAVVNQAASVAGAWMLEKYDSVNPAALKRLIANGGAGILPIAWYNLRLYHRER